MERVIRYKKQSNGQDSWFIHYLENGKDIQAPELVYGFTVENWTLRYVLSQRSLLSEVETALNNLPEPNKTKALLAWEYSNTVSTTSDITKFVQSVLGLTMGEVVDIFWDAINLNLNVPQNRMAIRTSEEREEVNEGIKTIYKTVIIRKKFWMERFFDWFIGLFKKRKK